MDKLVLIVDDEKNIVDIVKYNLSNAGYAVISAYDGKEALGLGRSAEPDLILLDVMLPGMDGFEVCRTLRDEGFQNPIIMLTAREEETDKILGLELGADDYITKPFSMRELMARVKANIRRSALAPEPSGGAANSNIIEKRGLALDAERRNVIKNGEALLLTQREFDIICLLMSNPGKVFTRKELLSLVWQYDYFGDLRTVDVAVRRLREKIEDNPAEPCLVLTKRGAGYYFTD